MPTKMAISKIIEFNAIGYQRYLSVQKGSELRADICLIEFI